MKTSYIDVGLGVASARCRRKIRPDHVHKKTRCRTPWGNSLGSKPREYGLFEKTVGESLGFVSRKRKQPQLPIRPFPQGDGLVSADEWRELAAWLSDGLECCKRLEGPWGSSGSKDGCFCLF